MLKLLMRSVVLIMIASFTATADDSTQIYRDLSLKVRDQLTMKLSTPFQTDEVSYTLQKGLPLYAVPAINDLFLSPGSTQFIRSFWDKISLQDTSTFSVGTENIPLTCIYIEGHDNRFSGKTGPLIPDFALKAYLVANDYTCTGPINPQWPTSSTRKEAWDTYIYFEIRDPTIMLPTDITIRYRWQEFKAMPVDRGQP